MIEEIFNCFSPSYDNNNIEIGGRERNYIFVYTIFALDCRAFRD